MNRRTFLAVGGTAAIGGVAGCLGGGDGYATNTVNGIDVPLAPVKDVYEWYEDDEARIVDSRGRAQYEALRIADAVFSPAPNGTANDPVEEWSTDTQIVTYCRCPHHLSSQRAAALIDAGYEDTYAIDEGLDGWVNNEYPIAGSNVQAQRQRYEISGTTDSRYADQMVSLEQVTEDRRELAPIEDDGSYTLQLYYAGSTDSRFKVKAPDYTTEGTLEELTSETVTI